MPKVMQDLIEQYIEAVKKIYGSHVCKFCSNGTPILKSAVHSF